jgi:hypothetical protein
VTTERIRVPLTSTMASQNQRKIFRNKVRKGCPPV